MKPVICFGEALIDFLNTGKQTDGCLSLNDYRQYPGGAPANAAVAIAKLGGKAHFSGQVGNDAFGDFLEQALVKYGVDTSYLAKHPSASTALAFVTLDDDGDRSFSFYRQDTADVLFSAQQIDPNWFKNDVIFHFCSNTLTAPLITQTTKEAIGLAHKNEALISFDVNLRHNLWPTKSADKTLINECVYCADIIKFSREEFTYLADGNITKYVNTCLNKGVSLLVITDGEHEIEFITSQGSSHLPVPNVTAVDTTAGGDAFSGALLMAFSHIMQPKAVFQSKVQLEAIIRFASFCGAHAVTKLGAFPALPYFNDVEKYWPTDLLGNLLSPNVFGESHAIL